MDLSSAVRDAAYIPGCLVMIKYVRGRDFLGKRRFAKVQFT
jgi:hypothetical protein